MRKLLASVCFLLFGTVAIAQPYGNEWINHTQKYLKIRITSEGIYRIDSTSLSNALSAVGTSLSSIDPRNLQVFREGAEEYIYVQGESDGVFNTNDFVEFYARGNDGKPDSVLFGATLQSNPYVSLFNDTAVYFLTWNNATNNRRLTLANDTALSTYTPVPSFIDEEYFIGRGSYFAGVTDILDVTDPDYLNTEGYFDYEFYYGGSTSHAVSTRNAYAGNADVELRVISLADDFSTPNDNHIQIQSPALAAPIDSIYDGYHTMLSAFTVPASNLGSSSTNFTVSSINSVSSASSGRTALAWIKIRYPHTTDMENRSSFGFFLADNTSQSKSRLAMTNLSPGALPVHLYDLSNHKRIDAINSSPGVYEVLVPNSGSEKHCFLGLENSYTNIAQLTPVNSNGTFTDYSLQATDSAFIMVTHPSLMTVAQQYKTYRQSIAGHSRNVVLADIHDLTDQFAYGVQQSPLAIRRFADFLLDTYPTAPQQLFLFGKSYSGEQIRYNPALAAQNLVPTIGYPASDPMMTAGLNGTQWEPAIPTGRLAAKNTTEAQWYLDKVMQYESNPPAEWMKEVLHFGGGSDSIQGNLFKFYLNNYKTTIEDSLYGGHVRSFFKNNTAPIQINTSDSLRHIIEDGVSIMTFFGHASGTGFDQSIDDPNNYNNSPHYPLLIANSCYAGDIHSTIQSSSELFVLLQNKGTIGYIASTNIGIAGFLDLYTGNLYHNIASWSYGQSIGYCMKRAVVGAEAINGSLYSKAACYEMTLHGDPSIIVNAHPKPDYKITASDVYFDQTSQIDTITVFSVMHNIGRVQNDSFIVQLIRRFPNGDTMIYTKQVKGPYNKDTLAIKIPVDFQRGIGLNKIKVKLDLFNQIDELSEINNTTTDVDLLIHGSTIVPIWPYTYAIIPNDTITLKASTANPFEPVHNYRFEIDTTDLFNSPMLMTNIVSAPGGVVSWKPPITFTDSTVYFWRVSPDSTAPTSGFYWLESSFQYITGKWGWEQAHYFQFKNDDYQYVTYNRPNRSFDFVNDVKVIDVKNGVYNYAVPWNEVWYKVNGATQHIFSCVFGCGYSRGVTVAVFDSISGNPWHFNLPAGSNPFGNCVCVQQDLFAYDFQDTDTPGRDSIANFINNHVPNGDYVLVYSQNLHDAPAYGANIQTAFQSIGCSNITSIPDTTAFIIFGKKGGAPGSAHMALAANRYSVVTLQDSIISNWREGYIRSEVVGPAQAWHSLHWRQKSLETPTNDSIKLRLIGISNSGVETTLYDFPADSTDVLDLANYANAQAYPRLKLLAIMSDDSTRTPAQMLRWQVIFDPVPEAAVNPPLGVYMNHDTLQEGDILKMAVAVQNVSAFAFSDSLLIHYWLVDHNRNMHTLPPRMKAPPFVPYSSFMDTVSVNTTDYPGINELWMEVNPVGDPNTQLEQYHFNNVAMRTFDVSVDKINPLLDVTFDGVHIMDRDLISAKPSILIKLKDENQFLALNDTSDFNVFLRRPSQTVAQLMPWNASMLFTPAVLPSNSCKILFTPDLPEDGIYDLIVQAKDRSSNQSGMIDYKISFEVENKPTITYVYNYPNPFSTSTRFVFTLTGSEVPEVFKIQIMTITGKVVREIDKSELGALHIGKNLTEYAWDGRDEFGDQLANGLYLYRVYTKLNGSDIDHRETSADHAFSHSFGKMYLIR